MVCIRPKAYYYHQLQPPNSLYQFNLISLRGNYWLVGKLCSPQPYTVVVQICMCLLYSSPVRQMAAT